MCLLLVAMPFVPSSFLFLVVRLGAPFVASLLLVAMPFVPSSFLFLVVRPGAPVVASDRSVRSDARSPFVANIVPTCSSCFGHSSNFHHESISLMRFLARDKSLEELLGGLA